MLMELRRLWFDNTGTLRSGWRVAIFLLIVAAFGSAFSFVLRTGSAALGGLRPGSATYFTLNGVVSLVSALSAGWICARFLENLPFRSLGFPFHRRAVADAALGGVWGAAAIAGAVSIAFAFGGLDLLWNQLARSTDILTTLGTLLIVFAAGAAFEEALFRGYMLQTLNRAGFGWIGIAVTSLLFAMAHNSNPNATWISWANTYIAGVWFALAWLRTRSLWYPLGMHLTWNWLQGPIFGVEVSGLGSLARPSLLLENDRGPLWLTGGDYGIEGGIACTAALLTAIVVLCLVPFPRPKAEMLALTSPAKEAVS
jgi:uncharacterized protein